MPQSSSAQDARSSAARSITTRPFIHEYIGNLHIVASCPHWQFGTWRGEESKSATKNVSGADKVQDVTKNVPGADKPKDADKLKDATRGPKACLLQLQFNFIPGFRLPKAEIDITFSTEPDLDGDAVTVQAFGPAQLQGSTTTDTIGTKHAFTPTVTAGIPVANLGLALTSEHDSSYARIWDGFIEGDASLTPGHVTRNHIKWFLSEDSKQSLGVPSTFQPAIIVSYEEGASITMQCKVTIKPGLKHWWGISKNPLVWAKSRIFGIPVSLDSAAKDGSPVPLVQLAARVVSDDAAPKGQPKDTDKHIKAAGEAEGPSAVDFGTMTLDQWQRIWSSRWQSGVVDTPDETATIFDVLHRSITLGDHGTTASPASSLAPAPVVSPAQAIPPTQQTQPNPYHTILIDSFRPGHVAIFPV